ncbi:hypothetical protein C8Q75DRAFT_778137 [Abortiporus biennis]|nr:hypothetical protein C8Q75DRAFT_778137 [Abortiporus biennis]
MAPFGPRTLAMRIFLFGSASIAILALYHITLPQQSTNFRGSVSGVFKSGRVRSSCTPEAWSNGSWVPGEPKTNFTRIWTGDDAMKFAGFDGCAADREFHWHLGSDNPSQWHRFPGVTSWSWKPSSDCQDLLPLDNQALVQDLVENGGWLLIGDSVTENHFFSLACLLSPHVRATPNFTALGYYEHDWPQNLFLSPTTPLLKYLRLPLGFNISITPLVTFRRVDLLLSGDELVNLYEELRQPPPNFRLLSPELYFSMSPKEYLDIFTKPLPEGNYGTMIVSTAGHWTTHLFSGLRDDAKWETGSGIDNIIAFFGEAMMRWADEVQLAMSIDNGTQGGRKRQVVARAYLPGHNDCHNTFNPWEEDKPEMHTDWNWFYIDEFNQVFKGILSSSSYSDIHFVSTDRPGRLRPDSHTSNDCLHLISGTGVLEGWTHYIWHYITREISGKIR